MALKITLKPHEKIIVAGAVIRNGDAATSFLVENNVPVLREKNILRRNEADSPAKRIYYVVQLMYVDPDRLTRYHALYWRLIRDFLRAVPSSFSMVHDISRYIQSDRHYRALKSADTLIEYEQGLLRPATGRSARAGQSIARRPHDEKQPLQTVKPKHRPEQISIP